jgi:hypothetical protein
VKDRDLGYATTESALGGCRGRSNVREVSRMMALSLGVGVPLSVR